MNRLKIVFLTSRLRTEWIISGTRALWEHGERLLVQQSPDISVGAPGNFKGIFHYFLFKKERFTTQIRAVLRAATTRWLLCVRVQKSPRFHFNFQHSHVNYEVSHRM